VNVHGAVAVGFGFFTHPRVCNNALLACLRRVPCESIRSSGRVFRGRNCIGILVLDLLDPGITSTRVVPLGLFLASSPQFLETRTRAYLH